MMLVNECEFRHVIGIGIENFKRCARSDIHANSALFHETLERNGET